MLFKNVDRSDETHTQVAIVRVSLDTRRKYIAKARTWQEFVASIRQRFALGDADELQIVDEHDTDIEEPIYTLLAPFLNELKVIVATPTKEAPKPEKATRARVSARKSVRYSLVYNKPAGADDDAIEDISEAEEEDKGDETHPGGDEEPYDEEEVEQELQQHRTKSPVRPVVMREHASFQHEPQEEEEEEEEEEELYEEPPQEPPEEERPKPKVVEQPPYHRNAPSPALPRAPQPPAPQPQPAPPKMKREKPAPASTPDGRFAVHISCPQIDKDAEFNIRGKHLCKKVLYGACKTFDISPENAQLFLKLPVEDDNGVTLESYVCDPDETMNESGVTADSSLEIVFDE